MIKKLLSSTNKLISKMFSKKRVVLQRFVSNDKQTLGILTVYNNDTILFTCKTLELPDKNNAEQISCIPKGIYDVKWTLSPSFKKMTYEILNVPNRKGVRIHSANFYHQIKGCIALGSAHKNINADDELDVIHSGKTMKQFEEEIMKTEDFKLVIR